MNILLNEPSPSNTSVMLANVDEVGTSATTFAIPFTSVALILMLIISFVYSFAVSALTIVGGTLSMLNESTKLNANPALSTTVSFKCRLLLIVSFDSNSYEVFICPIGEELSTNLESFRLMFAILLYVPFAYPNTRPAGPIILLPPLRVLSKVAFGNVLSIENASLMFVA